MSEEIVLSVFEEFESVNDNTVLSVRDVGSSPTPFPLTITEDDLAELFFDVASAQVADRHSIYLLQEEWLVL